MKKTSKKPVKKSKKAAKPATGVNAPVQHAVFHAPPEPKGK